MIFTAVANPSLAPSIKASYTLIRFQAAIPINTMMIPNRMMLLATFETTVTASLSKVEKYQITPAIKAEIPPK